ncbi:hypothetical protein CONLIGDRAFT_719324 [Coniochaeta ligniaria NRRL 30616]|uniref:Uncharacterized protein n=1 Tax=Coniochaeta ligniaria NRRL 30616 TaxID=1408157 RepID=A0A1J7IRJ3_9PEZI|nr:hypothetical protein CONLIGDRAFT_719324 [Coniochaeta ligniaria NRRL 30616]
MSRITAPVSKLTRTLGANASIARPSHLLSNGSKSAAAAARKPDLGDHHHVESHDTTTRHLSTLPSHPPQPVPSRTRTVPLMQTFTTTSSPSARADTSSIDFAIMPSPSSLYTVSSPPTLRVPLLPDSFTLAHAPETLDAPLPKPEISVVAASPENVLAVSPLTEVEGMGADGVELGFVHGLGGKEAEAEGGMIRDLWKGLMEDVFGEEKNKPKAA